MDLNSKCIYKDDSPNVSWSGHELDPDTFAAALNSNVKDRLEDAEGRDNFHSFLGDLEETGFTSENIKALLEEDVPESRDWAICESISEAWLESKEAVIWPWNSDRDLKTPLASLPGADLVGFKVDESGARLVLGEVKASNDKDSPPNVMYGRKGMIGQLEELAVSKRLRITLIKWLFARCNNSPFESTFKNAVQAMFASEHFRDVQLYGVLIRDTDFCESDVKNRAIHLSSSIHSPQSCTLYCLYLPCKISELPDLIEE